MRVIDIRIIGIERITSVLFQNRALKQVVQQISNGDMSGAVDYRPKGPVLKFEVKDIEA